jgi:hypothetical protein
LRAELVSVAVDPPPAHPESASDIARADESVRALAQFGGDPVSDGLDVLIVEHQCLAPRADAEQLRPKCDVTSHATAMGTARRPGGTTASQTRRSTWHLDLSIISTDRRAQKSTHDHQRPQMPNGYKEPEQPRSSLGRQSRCIGLWSVSAAETERSRVKKEEPADPDA